MDLDGAEERDEDRTHAADDAKPPEAEVYKEADAKARSGADHDCGLPRLLVEDDEKRREEKEEDHRVEGLP